MESIAPTSHAGDTITTTKSASAHDTDRFIASRTSRSGEDRDGTPKKKLFFESLFFLVWTWL